MANSNSINRGLSRYQATFLDRLPMNLEHLQQVKQTCVRSCYLRGLIEIRKGLCQRTTLGDEIVKEYDGHAKVERAASMWHADFTGVLRELVYVSRYMAKQRQEDHGLRVVARAKVA